MITPILVTAFVLMILVFVSNFKEKITKGECRYHRWSKNLLTNQLECLDCNQKAGNYE